MTPARRWGRRALAGTSLLVAMNIGMLSLLLAQRSAQGKAARETQCAREPVIRKLVVAGRHYGLLNEADVKAFDRYKPRDCPPRP